MSFYGGRPGQSFTISRVFKNFVEMYQEAQDSTAISNLYYDGRVPVGSFVLIAYGLGYQSTFAEMMYGEEGENSVNNLNSSYVRNRQEELDWFALPNCPINPVNIAADYNATVWWNIPWSESNDYNGSVWVKCYDSVNNSYYYAYVANIAGIFPAIQRGQWVIGGVDTGIRAEGRQVEFKAFYDENLPVYAFLTYTPPAEEVAVLAEETPEEEEEAPKPRPAQFGLSNLADRFIYNEVTGSYSWSEDGDLILVYEADKLGHFIFNGDGGWKELGYFTLDDWDSVSYPLETTFTSDKLKWRYEDEENWHDLFEISDLTNVKNFMLTALEASQSTEAIKGEIEEIKAEIDSSKEFIEQKAGEAEEWIAQAEGVADNANAAVAELQNIINNLPTDETLKDSDYLIGLIENAKGNFATIDQRLDTMPYQFNLIKDMRSCISLERGDKAFTFGKDEVGDDDSKLFQIFDPDNFEEDKARLEETDEALISVYNPKGLKIDETYKIGTSGLIAGKLTVFSGKGSGSGGGGTIPTLSSSLTSVAVQSGQTVTIDWYWTSANGGNGTIFIKDSMSNSPIVDVADKNKNYTVGVTTKRGANESFVWKPADGVHKLTMYVVDGGGIPTNNIEIDITVGGIAYSSIPVDGQNYSTDAVINLSYKFSTIYKTDKVVLHYDVYNNNVLMPELSGEKESAFASGNQSINITLKTRETDIGVGVFKVVTYAFMKSDPNVVTNQLTRNFIIAEVNKIYLTTTFDGSEEAYANKTFYVPLTLTYSGGSSFTIEGKYSTTPGFNYEEGILFGTSVDISAGIQNQFPVCFTEPGTYYLKFYAKGVGVSATGESEELMVEVGEENKQYILQRQSDLLLNLSANEGQTNKNNRNRWDNTVKTADSDEKRYACYLTDFNYYANGWSTDGRGIPEGWLLFNSKAYALIKADIFRVTPPNGFTLECVFKVNDIGLDAPVLDWTMGVPGRGIYVYKDRAFINIPEAGVMSLTVHYEPHGIAANNEALHVAFVFDAVNRYAKIYLNGVLSAASELTYSELVGGKYMNYNNIFLNYNGEADPSKMIYGNCKIAAVRLYSDALTSDELVKNYIYNLQDEILQRNLWSKAGFVEKDGEELQTPPTDGSVPYMKFFLKRADWERMTKDDKVSVTIHYYEKGSTTPIIWYNTKTSWQGTSSIAYPVKNFKFKLQKDLEGNKQTYKLDQSYGKKENTFCLKADYMDSSHIHNTGNANLIHNSGIFSKYTLTAAQASECGLAPEDSWVLPDNKDPKSLATRATIYGYPILLYICLESENEEAGGTAKYTDEQIALNPENLSFLTADPISLQLKAELDVMSPSDEGYEEKKAEYDLAVAQYAVANRVYEPDKFWGIYNFNLDKGSNASWGLQREDEYGNYDMSDCTSFEIAANSAYSGGGFRCLKYVKKNGAEEYGWTRPYVYFNLDGNINMGDNTYWSITLSNPDGSVDDIAQKIVDNYNGNNYTCYQNKVLDITGFAQDGVRYILNSDTNTYESNEYGDWVILYEMDSTTFKLKVDGEGKIVRIPGYYQLNSEWKDIVEINYTTIGSRSEWSIVEQLPENKDFYYDYYIKDLELRFPDMEVYLFKSGDDERYNKLLYKEYDKIIALVDYVDSYRDANQKLPDGTTFLSTVADHFEEDGLLNYYLFVMAVGLIDNFGKNMMMDTWGFDKNHQRPYRTSTIDGKVYQQMYRYLGTWNEDEEYYTGIDDFEYGLLDISNPVVETIDTEKGQKIIQHYKIYPCDASYSRLISDQALADVTATPGISNELIWDDVVDDDKKTGWIHEIYEDKLIWCPHCYDLDSCLSSDNSGNLVFTPSIEMEDTYYVLATDESKEVKAPPFNTSSSSLWSKVANGMKGKLATRYKKLQNDILTLDNFYETYYTNAIDLLGQRWYNGDAIPKYLSRSDIKVIINNQEQTRKPIEFINLARGSDWQRTYKWLKHRLSYLGSMYDRDGTEGYAAGLEPRGSKTGVTYSFDLELYEPMYMKIVGKNNQVSWVRSNKYNNKVVITAPSTNDAADQEMYILPAGNIKSIKERHGYGYATFKQNAANRLLEVDLSGSSELKAWNRYIPKDEADAEYEAGKEQVVIKPENNLIQSIKLKGCSSLTGSTATIMGADYPLLKTIDIRDSGAVFNFNNGTGNTDEGGGILTEALLNDKVSSLDIKNHFELEKVLVQLKYDEHIGSEVAVQSGHKTSITSVNIQNCPKMKLDIQYQIKNGPIYIDAEQNDRTNITNFIDKVGPFALFQDINRFIISNALNVENNSENIKELKLSLSKADLISINGCDINKIAFIAYQYKLRGTDCWASYPGTGGYPSTSDDSYQSSGGDGLSCDENITSVEIRNAPGSNAEFKFPWRVHLGTLTKLQEFVINVTEVKPKKYNQNVFGPEDSADIGITSNKEEEPARFELILPDSSKNPSFNKFYINPKASSVNFTCVKQPGVNYDKIEAALALNYVNNKKYFSGIDLRGYNSLMINFKGFKKITGILGMDSIDVFSMASTYGPEIFAEYFSDCQNLQQLYSYRGNTNVTWDFEDWANSKGKVFTTLSKMFQNCFKLEDKYIKGWKRLEAQNLVDASYMFSNCQALTNIDSWIWKVPALETVEGMFNSCYKKDTNTGLNSVNMSFINAENLTNIAKMFYECHALHHTKDMGYTPVRIYNSTGSFDTSRVTNMSNLFYGCSSMVGISFENEDEYGNREDWHFDSVKSTNSMFKECSELTDVRFPNKAKFINATDMASMFEKCVKLQNVFNNIEGNEIQLYDPENGTKELLTLQNFFMGCGALENIYSFAIVDMSRVSNFSQMFANNTNLKGSTVSGGAENNILDLTNWVTSDTQLKSSKPLIKSLQGMFQGCTKLQGILLPEMKNVSNITSMFLNCIALTSIDMTPLELVSSTTDGEIIPNVGTSSLAGVFQGCGKLASILGYEDWNVQNVNDFSNLFAGCAGLTTLDLRKWKFTSRASSLLNMFQSCTQLQWIYGLRELVGTENDYEENNIYLSNVKNMFDGCKNLNLGRDDLPLYEDAKCDLRYWDYALSTVDSFEFMFRDCKQLQSVYKIFQENFNTYVGKNCTFEKLTSFKEMFSGCTQLQELTYFGSNFKMKSDTLETIEGIVSGCSSLTNFTFIPKGCTFSGMSSTGMNNAFYDCDSLSIISLITGNALKSYVDIDTLGTDGSTYSTWDTLFAHLAQVCFDFSGDIKPDADLKEGLIYLPPVPAAVEAFEKSVLFTQMKWQAAETA